MPSCKKCLKKQQNSILFNKKKCIIKWWFCGNVVTICRCIIYLFGEKWFVFEQILVFFFFNFTFRLLWEEITKYTSMAIFKIKINIGNRFFGSSYSIIIGSITGQLSTVFQFWPEEVKHFIKSKWICKDLLGWWLGLIFWSISALTYGINKTCVYPTKETQSITIERKKHAIPLRVS